MSQKITSNRLREVLSFDPNTGVFIWKISKQGVRIGSRAGSVDPNGYRYIRIDQEDYLAQRLAWFWEYGKWPRLIRFNDGDRDNCSIANLSEGFSLNRKIDWKNAEQRSAYQKEYRSVRRDKFSEDALQRSFGIGLAEYEMMLATQNGLCAICGQPERAKRNGRVRRLAVDHDHITGEIRELLCSNCNPMIGYAGDSTAILEKAIIYLNKHNSRREGSV